MNAMNKNDGIPRLDEGDCESIAWRLGLSTDIQASNITGGFGNVFITDDKLGRKVAVKVLFKDWHKRRLEREWNAVRRLCAERNVFNNLVTIYASGEDDKYLYYTMECANNCASSKKAFIPDTLERRINHRVLSERPSQEEIWKLFYSLMDAVETLHSKNMAHLDIKPDNIYCIGDKFKLGDYSLITSKSVFYKNYGGTPGFYPEYRRYLDETTVDGVDSDLYALGKVLYNYVTLEPASNYPKLPKDFPDISFYNRINNFLLKACNSSEEERFHDISDFRKGFDDCFPQKKKRRLFLSFIIPLVIIILVALLEVNYRATKRSESNRRSDLWQQALEKREAADLKSITMPTDIARKNAKFSGMLGFNDKSINTTNVDIFEAGGQGARHFAEKAGKSSYFFQTGNGLTLHLEKGKALELPVKSELPNNFEFAFLCTGNVPCHIRIILDEGGTRWFGRGVRLPDLKANVTEGPFMADFRVVRTVDADGECAILYMDGTEIASCNIGRFSGKPMVLKLVFEADEPGSVSISTFRIWECK